jgi:hypothetical protein
MTTTSMVHPKCRSRHRTFTVSLRHVPQPETGVRIIAKHKAELAKRSDASGLGQEPDQQRDREPRENDQSETQQKPAA